MSPYNLYQFILRFTELFLIYNYSRIIASGGIFTFYYIAYYPIPATRSYNETALAQDNTDHFVGRYGLQMICAKYNSRKLTGRFAQQGMIRAIVWMFCASKLLCCVSFKLIFNYVIYQLFVWALLVADVIISYMHLSTKYYTL